MFAKWLKNMIVMTKDTYLSLFGKARRSHLGSRSPTPERPSSG